MLVLLIRNDYREGMTKYSSIYDIALVKVFEQLCSINDNRFLLRNFRKIDGYATPLGEQDDSYRSITREHELHLLDGVGAGDLVIMHESLPSVAAAVAARGAVLIDVRLSPLRYLSDLLVAIRVSDGPMRLRMEPSALTRGQATYAARYMQVRQDIGFGSAKPDEAETTVFLGQFHSDLSLLHPDTGRSVTFADYVDQLATIRSDRFQYKPHPYARPASIGADIALLRRIRGDVSLVEGNIYDIFVSGAARNWVALSSGAVQEAEFFGHQGRLLFRPYVPLAWNSDAGAGFQQFHWMDFCNPAAWAAWLGWPNVQVNPVMDRAVAGSLRDLYQVSWGLWQHEERFSRSEMIKREQVLHSDINARVDLGRAIADFLLAAGDPSLAHDRAFVGDWRWFNDWTIRFEDGGRVFVNGSLAGSYAGYANGSARIDYHDGMFVDYLSLSNDGLHISGFNSRGDAISATRVPPPQPEAIDDQPLAS